MENSGYLAPAQLSDGTGTASRSTPKESDPFRPRTNSKSISTAAITSTASPLRVLLAKHEEKRHSSHGSSNLVLLELCCGSASLCKAFNSNGYRALGVDHLHNKQVAKAPVFVADLSDSAGQKMVDEVITEQRPAIVHAGPPCGTSSRARERPIAKELIRQGAPQPRPLRSEAFPLGLPNLTDVEQKRVTAANSIYKYVLTNFIERHRLSRFFSLENPTGSLFWLHPLAIVLMNTPGVLVIDFEQCAHGGLRPVWRRWVTNMATLQALSLRCPGVSATHPHRPFQHCEDIWTVEVFHCRRSDLPGSTVQQVF